MNNINKKVWPGILTILMLVLAIAAFAPGLSGGFFFDDEANIVKNKAVQIEELSLSALQGSLQGPAAGPLGRPVSVLSFALTHASFGLDPFAFKLVNLAIHCVNGLLVAWLVSLLLAAIKQDGRSAEPAQSSWLPFWVAAVWMVHPINVLPVMLVVQRMTLLSAMFLLFALIAHIKAMTLEVRGKAYWSLMAVSWLLFWPLSMLSKETGLLFPLYLLAIVLFFPRVRGGAGRVKWVMPLLFMALIAVTFLMLSYLGTTWLEAGYQLRTFTMNERLLTESRVLWFYVSQIITPQFSAFAVYHDGYPISVGLFQPIQTIFAVLAWVCVLGLAWVFRIRYPLQSFALVWFLAGHSLESTFLPLEIAQEYRNYLPSLGLILGIGSVGSSALDKIKLNHRMLKIWIVAMVPVVVVSLFTWLRCNQLGAPVTGAQIEAERHPESARANYSAALALISAGYGNGNDAVGGKLIHYYLTQAGKADPSYKLNYLGLMVWACASGRTIDRVWVDELAKRLSETPLSPQDRDLPSQILSNLMALPQCLDRRDALRLFEAGALNLKASALVQARFLDAASDYQLLVSVDPSSAREYLMRAVKAAPSDGNLRNKLAGFAQMGHLPSEKGVGRRKSLE